MASTKMRPDLRRRLLTDIAEVQRESYPHTHFHINDEDLSKACLVLEPQQFYQPLHLSIHFTENYPIQPPKVSIQTRVEHPNIYGNYICASILTGGDWTPAYTLKGIIMQLLSFFMSDTVEQQGYKVEAVDLRYYRESDASRARYAAEEPFKCETCGYDENQDVYEGNGIVEDVTPKELPPTNVSPLGRRPKLLDMPDEIIVDLLSFVDTIDLFSMSEAVPSIRGILRSYDVMRLRDLQCFVLKKSFMDTKLGIGVSIVGANRKQFRSEFDLISNDAYNLYGIRRSMHGIPFDNWLPLPLSRRHWKLVEQNTFHCLEGLRKRANLQSNENVSVLYHFMNTIVVQFSNDADASMRNPYAARSTLAHASEKAVESYYALFHVLLCIATSDATVVPSADKKIAAFLAGPRTKKQFPDLGHVLVAALISGTGLTQNLITALIKEAILRNVVWMLDTRGAGMAEMAYIEPTKMSRYRLYWTFQASKTSYRLLMFLKLFNSMARQHGKSLVEIRDELFDSHGAPPHGMTEDMMEHIHEIHSINTFPQFLTYMGIKEMPTAVQFTNYLKRTIKESEEMGYSRSPMSQSELYMIRNFHDMDVEKSDEVVITRQLENWFNRGELWFSHGWNGRPSFFPEKAGADGDDRGGRGGRGGRGRGRGRGRGG